MARPIQYSTETLKSYVLKFIEAYPDRKVDIAALVEFSKISKNTWYRNKEINEYINRLNRSPLQTKYESGITMTCSEIFRSCNNDPIRLKEVISQLLDIIQSSSIDDKNKSLNFSEDKTMEYVKQIEELKDELKKKNKIIENMNKKINIITATDDKLINMQDNIDKMNVKTFSEQFKELFDDEDDE